MEEAQKNFARAQELLDKKLIAKADFDRASAEFNAAKARLESSAAAQAEAEQNLAYTTLVAPYSGILVTRHVRVGESVAPGTPLLTGLSLAQLRVAVDIPQQHIGPLRKHRTARVQLPGGEWIAAKQLRIPPAADSNSQTFKVLVELPEIHQEVFPGTLVKVGFMSGEQQQLAVPSKALVKRGELTAVYVLPADGPMQLRYVRIGMATQSDEVPVLAGLTNGEWIAADPVAAALAYKETREDTTR
jgi:RND family efflux transporter MFP subunit